MSSPTPAAPRVTRCWTLVADDGALDVEVRAEDDALLGTVLGRLAEAVGGPAGQLWHGSDRLDARLPLTSPVLAHGAVLGLGRPGPRPAGSAPSALALHVVSGPDAGRSVALGRGRLVIGRGTAADLRLADPDVSRQHAVVDVGAGGVTVADSGSSNGSHLDGVPLGSTPLSWPDGGLLRVGATALAVRGPHGARAGESPAPGGRTVLHPAPRLVLPRPEVEVHLPAAPGPPQRRALAATAIALPAVAGVLAAWLLDAPTFLFFALLGPVVALGSWLADRWSGRRRGRREAAAHAAGTAAAAVRLEKALRADLRLAEAAAPDLARLTTAARRRSAPLWERRRDDPDAVTVRVGCGPGGTRVVLVAADGRREQPAADRVPVTVDLAGAGGLVVAGPRRRAVGVLAGVLGQLATLLGPAELSLALLTTPDRLPDWSWLRWLPHPATCHVHPDGTTARSPADGGAGDAALAWLTALTARRTGAPGATTTAAGSGAPGWVVVLLDRPAGPGLTAALRAARPCRVLVLTPAAEVAGGIGAVLQLTGETGATAVLREGAREPRQVTVDELPAAVAAALARDLAPLAAPAPGSRLPSGVRLLDLTGPGPGARGAGIPGAGWSRRRDALITALGRSTEGRLEVDLCRDGPHALVAGTTGSGKSELLQSLIGGLALRHPPDRCSFLMVDYKGGAAFAEAASLPHTVGLVTDLDARTTARALRSLGAELARREALLADHHAADLAGLPETVALARLVIVVDEFAGLAEELPGFVSGLVAIAQRGRSLGVHLVLATQRPAGVVSPEIRANCSLRICLRTTDEADSRDVLGTAAAAHLPAHLPGRGYLRVGGAPATLFQVARVAGRPGREPAGPVVRRWPWPRTTAVSVEEADGPTDLAVICAGLREHAVRTGCPAPYRPWRPALPDRLTAADLDVLPHPADRSPAGRGAADRAAADRSAADRAAADRTPEDRSPEHLGNAAALRIGLVDRPERQRQQPLVLDLAEGGGWLAVGGPRSGRSTLLRTVLSEAVRALAPEELHVHVLDHGGGAVAAAAGGLPHTGTTVGGADPVRTVRLLDRLAQEVASRRGAGGPAPRLLLLVDGVEALCDQLDDVDPGRGSAALLRLVREGAAAGLTCVLTGDRAVPGGRLAGAVARRLVLPLPDRADYGVAGVPARAVPEHRPPGRALLGDEAAECQLAMPRPLPQAWPAAACTRSTALRIVELAADPVLPLPARSTPGPGSLLVPLGPGGDEGAVLAVDLLAAGGLLVAGPPGSGRAATVAAVVAHLAAAGVPVLRVGRTGRVPDRAVSTAPPAAGGEPTASVSGADVTGWRRWLDTLAGAPGVAVVDDHGASADSPVLTALAAGDLPADVVLVAAGAAGELSGAYRGPVAALRRRRSGLLLCPGPGDADLLGIRLPRTPVPTRPGSGWLVRAGVVERVQVALRRTPPGSPDGAEPAPAGRS